MRKIKINSLLYSAILLFLFLTICVQASIVLSPCSIAIKALGEKWPLDGKDLFMIIKGNEQVLHKTEMGKNALSFMASAIHLSGEQKAELWRGFRKAIIGSGAAGSWRSNEVFVKDKTVAVFQSPYGETLIIELATGKMYRGMYHELIPQEWSLKEELERGKVKLWPEVK